MSDLLISSIRENMNDNLFSSLTGCLDSENFKQFKLVKRDQLSHNVAKFVFELPTPTSVLGLPIGQHISCRLDSLFKNLQCCIFYDRMIGRRTIYLMSSHPIVLIEERIAKKKRL